jgi:phospholipid/cholesterol/gamma-HCH transport system substrate-binding protein
MKTMERSPIRDFVVGVFVLAGIGAIAYLSLSVGGFSLQNNRNLRLWGDFNEIGDLTERAPVMIAGVRVGEISRITLEKNFRARVEMELESNLKLPADTSAAIMTAGVLGDRYIELQPGGEEQLLKTGDKIEYTQSAVILERLIGQLITGLTSPQKQDETKGTTTVPGAAYQDAPKVR